MHFELYGDFKPHSPFGEGWPGAARIGVNGSYELRDLKASYDPPFTLKNIDLSAENTQPNIGMYLIEFKALCLVRPEIEEAASWAGKEERIKGYRVKVQYQPVMEAEKKVKREAVGQVIMHTLRRMKEGS